ncbi:MAG: M48 family metallopeptidase [Pyrinomonadaceae bacterium]|nr:M48 family metallopeptidase [Pyrinomonadaceae bacterium]
MKKLLSLVASLLSSSQTNFHSASNALAVGKKRFFAVAVVAAFCLIHSPNNINAATIKDVKVRGYITNITSANSFEIDDYKVTKDDSLTWSLENQDAAYKFKPEDIRIGTEVEVQGSLNDETRELKAKKLTADLEQFRKLENTTVLTVSPEGIIKGEKDWSGVFIADGRRIRIEPTTQVLFQPNKSEKKVAEANAKAGKDKKDAKVDENEVVPTEPLKDVSEVKAGMFVTYEGIEQADGTVLASKVVFIKNELEKGEDKMWKSLKIREKDSNFFEKTPGELKVSTVGKFKLLPNKEVQDYVQRIGQSLIPAYQKALPDTDPQKINFRFYVINDKDANAFALPNGIVVINSGMLELLKNEAQLAAVMAHEISHATQEHTWRQMNKDKGKRTAIMIGSLAASLAGVPAASSILNLALGAMVNGYQRRLENQADRIGLEYMVAAGYDPREAPQVWKLMSQKYGDKINTFFWSSHSNNATRRSFLMVKIRNDYSQLDLNQMKRGDEKEYETIASLTKEASAKKKKTKS